MKRSHSNVRQGPATPVKKKPRAEAQPTSPLDVRSLCALQGYEFGHRLATGGFCNVYKAVSKTAGGHRRAIVLKIPRCGSDGAMLQREFRTMLAIDHPCILNVRGMCWLRSMPVMLMDFAEGGDLYGLVERHKGVGLPLRDVQLVLLQLTDALLACHRAGVAHMDVKVENILLRSPGSVEHIMLCDFGVCASVSEAIYGTVGSLAYAAPEMLSKNCAFSGCMGAEADAWSVGVVAYVTAQGGLPWNEATSQCTIYAAYERAYYVSRGPLWRYAGWVETSPPRCAKYWDLLHSLLALEARHRASLEQARSKWLLPETWGKQPGCTATCICIA